MSSQEARDRGATQCFTKVTLAAGTTTTVTTTTAATYSIGGKIYVQGAAWTNKAHPTTDSNSGAAFVNIPANYGGVVVYGTDSGAISPCVANPLSRRLTISRTLPSSSASA